MRTMKRMMGIAGLALAIGLVLACSTPTSSSASPGGTISGGGDSGSASYSGFDADDNYYTLTIKAAGRAAYAPRAGDTYVLTMLISDVTGISTGTVSAFAGSVFTLSGGAFTVTVSGSAIESISGTIPLEDGGTQPAPGGVLTPTKSAGGGDPVSGFTSIAAFANWLSAQPDNTADTAYSAKLNVSALGSADTEGSLGAVLIANRKYVSLDLSGSTLAAIPDGAFYWLVTVNITDTSSTGIYYTGRLIGITIPDTVRSIGNNAFRGNPLKSITIPNNITSIGKYAFASTSLASVTFAGTISSSRFSASAFLGDLRDKFYATDSANGTPGTYTRSGSGTYESPYTWTKL